MVKMRTPFDIGLAYHITSERQRLLDTMKYTSSVHLKYILMHSSLHTPMKHARLITSLWNVHIEGFIKE
jgi:hypothetical protein